MLSSIDQVESTLTACITAGAVHNLCILGNTTKAQSVGLKKRADGEECTECVVTEVNGGKPKDVGR